MSLQHSLRRRELQIEVMNIQKEHLLVVQKRYRNWISDTDDDKINRLRHDIIESLGKIVDQYDHLLGALQGQESDEQEIGITREAVMEKL
jgi:hypothetical protein